jgi:type VI secretion system protein VasD
MVLGGFPAGCGSSQSPQVKSPPSCKELPLEIFLEARSRLNPNDQGQSTPVEVRVFFLKDRQVFDQLDFETVWQRGEKAVGSDLVNSVYITVYPGKLKIYPIKVSTTVGYVAMVAVFRAPSGRSWQRVVDIREGMKKCDVPDLHTVVHAALYDNVITAPDRAPAGQD